jgi:hypothetical protein
LRLFEIPYEADPSGGWLIPVSEGDEKRFTSRDKALAFALSLAIEDQKGGLGDSLVCVQGADKQWRLFTPDLLPAGASKADAAARGVR